MDADSAEDPKRPTHEEIMVTVPQTEFFLGLADLTGEVMRQAINMVGLGDVDACFELADFLHALNDGFATVDIFAHKEMGRKIRVIRQSIAKVKSNELSDLFQALNCVKSFQVRQSALG
jgi:predicted translin family RNA/ssDNA-binding protein